MLANGPSFLCSGDWALYRSSCPAPVVVPAGTQIVSTAPGGSLATAWCLDVALGNEVQSTAASGVGFANTEVGTVPYCMHAAIWCQAAGAGYRLHLPYREFPIRLGEACGSAYAHITLRALALWPKPEAVRTSCTAHVAQHTLPGSLCR